MGLRFHTFGIFRLLLIIASAFVCAIVLFSLTLFGNSMLWLCFSVGLLIALADARISLSLLTKRPLSVETPTTRAGSPSCSESPGINGSIYSGPHSGLAACQDRSCLKRASSMLFGWKISSTCADSRDAFSRTTLRNFLLSPIGSISKLVPMPLGKGGNHE